jgi:hypothetical protein
MTINEFIKAIQKEFGHVEYKATSKDGVVFKTKGWRDDKVVTNAAKFTSAYRKAQGS